MSIPLEADKYYHIYNHANGDDNLFVNDGNYHFFLKRYAHFIPAVVQTFAYCLMPNHFHFLIKIKSEEELANYFSSLDESGRKDTQAHEKLISKQFSNFFSSYTQAFNKQQRRMGSLFIKNFKRKHISDQNYLLKMVNYIHLNPVSHGFCESPRDWEFSSYNSLLSVQESGLVNKEVITWFEDRENFIHCHESSVADVEVELQIETL